MGCVRDASAGKGPGLSPQDCRAEESRKCDVPSLVAYLLSKVPKAQMGGKWGHILVTYCRFAALVIL